MDLILLHGPAAAGKLTIARELAARVNYPVFHNHLVVDLLTTVFPFGSEPFVRLREQMWLAVFEDAAREGRSIVFTFTPEPTICAGFLQRVAATVEKHGGAVRFVRLNVSPAEQEKRLGDESRQEFHKLTDVDTLRRLRKSSSRVEQPPADLTIVTDNCLPPDSAQRIIDHFGLQVQSLFPRY